MLSTSKIEEVSQNTNYSTLQYTTVHYSTLQYTTVRYSTLQHATVHYSTPQYSYNYHGNYDDDDDDYYYYYYYFITQHYTLHYNYTSRTLH